MCRHLLLWLSLTLAGHGAELRILDLQFDPLFRPVIRHTAETNRYYLILRGTNLTTLLPAHPALGTPGTNLWIDPAPPAREAYYLVRSWPLAAAPDTDGDGMNDAEELVRGRNPFVPDAAANEPPRVRLSSPLLNDAFTAPGFIRAVATASDPEGRLAGVEFFSGDLRLGEASAPPYEFLWRDVPAGNYVLSARAVDRDGQASVSAGVPIRVRERDTTPLTRLSFSPADTEEGVAVTREIVIRFSYPLAEGTILTREQFSARAAGRALLGRVELNSSRQQATYFLLENMPGSSEVTVTFNAAGVRDFLGREVDADRDGAEGGVGSIRFFTSSIAGSLGTGMIGRVFRSDPGEGALSPTNIVELPLRGVTVEVIGAEETMRTTTDAQGNFRLDPCPAGRFFVRVDGRTAEGSRWPDGDYYPVVEKAWEALPGVRDNRAGGSGDIYLPKVSAGTLQAVSTEFDTVIAFPDQVVARNPELAGVEITVPPNALLNPAGGRGGRIGLVPVAPDRLPEPLPSGLSHVLDISIQTDGPQNLDQPLPAKFPNLPDPVTGQKLPPGAKTALWSYNHDLGRWEMVGSMTVTADGNFAITDPGVGIRQPGWHGTDPTTPGAPGPGPGGGDPDGGDPDGGDPGGGDPGGGDPDGGDPGGGDPDGGDPDGGDPDGGGGGPDGPGPDGDGDGGGDGANGGNQGDDGDGDGGDDGDDGGDYTGPCGTAGNPVLLRSGEKQERVVDLRIPGVGMDFIWERTYLSSSGRSSIQGNRWDHGYNHTVQREGGGLRVGTGRGYRRLYWPTTGKPKTFGRALHRAEVRETGTNTYERVWSDGRFITYHPLDASPRAGKMTAMEDRNGNRLQFFYDNEGRLNRVRDTLDRDIRFSYNAGGRLAAITDFTGRTIRYSYYGPDDAGGTEGDLRAVTYPPVTGSPGGGDFPEGRTVTYTYTKGSSGYPLSSLLLSIVDGRRNDPRDPTFGQGAYLRNFYATNVPASDPSFAKVTRQVLGGGILDFTYHRLTPSPDNAGAARKTIVNDQNGHVREEFFDANYRLVMVRRYTGRANPVRPTTDLQNRPVGKLRPGDPDYFEVRYEYNDDSQISRIIHANGNVTEHVYQGDLDPFTAPRFRANLLRTRRLAGGHLPPGDQTAIEEQFEYATDHAGCCGFNFVTRHVDGRGNVRLQQFDDRGNLLARTNRLNNIVERWEYNARGQATLHVHPDNGSGYTRTDSLEYYEDGPLRGYLSRRVADVGGLNLTTVEIPDALGRIIRTVDPVGNVRTAVFNAWDLPVRVTREVRHGDALVPYIMDFAYDANRNLVRRNVRNLDEAGVEVAGNPWLTATFEYDVLNHLTRTTEEVDPARAVVTEHAYDDARNRILTRFGEAVAGRQPDNVVRYEHDERDLAFRTIQAPGVPGQSTTQFDYDGNGNRVRIHKGLEAGATVTQFVFDGFDRLVGGADPMGNVTTNSYDGAGNLVRLRVLGELEDQPGAAGNVRLSEVTMAYDAANRLTNRTVAHFHAATQAPVGDGAAVTTYEYAPGSQLLREINDNGHATAHAYDTAGRRRLTTDAAGNTVTLTYDANSNVIRQDEQERSDLDGSVERFTTTFAYDSLDRQVAVTNSVGTVVRLAYDSRDNLVLRTDGNGNTARFSYDGLNRLVRTAHQMRAGGTGGGAVTGEVVNTQGWDDSSRLASLTDANGHVTRQVYDGLNRLVATVLADGTGQTNAFDARHNIVRATDANGSVVTATYDALDRPLRREIAPGPGVHPQTTFEEFAYDGLSRLARSRNDVAEVTRRYDSQSKVVLDGQGDARFEAAFDGVGNLLESTYPGGRRLRMAYDALERLQAITEDGRSHATYRYAGPARVARVDYGNGTRLDYAYDGAAGVPNPAGDFGVRRVVRKRLTRVADGAVLDDWRFTWDRAGNKTRRAGVADGLPETAHDYRYDSLNRLAESDTSGGGVPPQQVRYALDGVHNRLTVDGGPDAGAYTQAAQLPEPGDRQVNQYTATPADGREYDRNGNLVRIIPPAGEPTTLAYDYRDRLVGVTRGDMSATYAYDAHGRRVSKTVTGPRPEAVRFLYAGTRVCEERDAAGQTAASYVLGRYVDERIAMRRGGREHYYAADDLFNVTCLTDGAGAVVERVTYADYGEPTLRAADGTPLGASPSGNAWLFGGHRHDAESGLHYLRTRYLSPRLGAFISRDRLGPWGGAGSLGNGLAYAALNPWSYVDPFGLSPCEPEPEPDEPGFLDGLIGGEWTNCGARWSCIGGQILGGMNPLGDARDIANHVWEGKWGELALDAVGLIPVVGDAIKYGVKHGDNVVDALRRIPTDTAVQPLKRQTTILGENMHKRVTPFADKTGAQTLPLAPPEQWAKMTPKERYRLNDGSLRTRINSGDTFRYIGQDPYRDPALRAQFDLTRSELLRLQERGISYETVSPAEVQRVLGRP
jgi:RHS repeat-associated protein